MKVKSPVNKVAIVPFTMVKLSNSLACVTDKRLNTSSYVVEAGSFMFMVEA